jgi:hypothetical protein
MAPTSFDIETAAQDFAGPGRQITCPHYMDGELEANEKVGLPLRKQMLVEVNGWVLSAVWGRGTYCTGARSVGTILDDPPPVSPDAEVAAWREGEPFLPLHGDDVEGWVSPASFLAAIEAAERDDEGGVRAALVRSEVTA